MADRVSTIRFRVEGANTLRSNMADLDKDIAKIAKAMEGYRRQYQNAVTGGQPTGEIEAQMRSAAERSQRILRAREIEQTRLMESSAKESARVKQAAAQSEGKMHSQALEMEWARANASVKSSEAAKAAEVKARAAQEASYTKFAVSSDQQRMQALRRSYDEQIKLHGRDANRKIEITQAYLRQYNALMASAGHPTDGSGGGKGGAGGTKHGRWQPGAYQTPAFGSMSDRFTAMFTVGNVFSDITGNKPAGREIGLAASGFLLGSPLFATINAAGVAVGAYYRYVREGAEIATKASEAFGDSLLKSSERAMTLAGNLAPITAMGKFGQTMARDAVQSQLKTMKELQEMVPRGRFNKGLSKLGEDFEANPGKAAMKYVPGWNYYYMAKKYVLGDDSVDITQAERSNTSRERAKRTRNREMDFDAWQEREGRGIEQRGKAIGWADQQRGHAQRMETIGLSAMAPGGLRDRAAMELEITHAIQNRAAASEQEREGARESQRIARETVARLRNELEITERLGKEGEKDLPAAKFRFDQAVKNARQTQEDAKRQPGQTAERDLRVQQEAAAKRRAMDADQARTLADQFDKTSMAQVRATTTGYEQTIRLREWAYAKEERDAARHGAAMLGSVQAMHVAMRAETARANQEKFDSAMASADPAAAARVFERQQAGYGGLSPEQSAALRSETLLGNYRRQAAMDEIDLALLRMEITQEEADIKRMEIADVRHAMPEVRAVIQAAAARKTEMRMEGANAAFYKDARQQQVQMQLIMGKITSMEAEYARQYWANPEAQKNTPEGAALRGGMWADADRKERVSIAQEFAPLMPGASVKAYDEFVQRAYKFNETYGDKGMDRADLNQLGIDKLESMIGKPQAGQFMGIQDYAKSMQTAISGEAGLSEKQLEATEKLIALLEDLKKGGDLKESKTLNVRLGN